MVTEESAGRSGVCDHHLESHGQEPPVDVFATGGNNLVMAPKSKKSFSDDLRRRILSSDMSLGELCRRSGVPKEVLSRFSRGLNGMSVRSIDAVFAALDLQIVGPEDEDDRPAGAGQRKKRRKAGG